MMLSFRIIIVICLMSHVWCETFTEDLFQAVRNVQLNSIYLLEQHEETGTDDCAIR